MKKVWRDVIGDDAGRKEVFAALRDGLEVNIQTVSDNWTGQLNVTLGILCYGQTAVGVTEHPEKFRIEVKPPEAGDGYRLLDHDKDEKMPGDEYRFSGDVWIPVSCGNGFESTSFYRRLQDGVEKIVFKTDGASCLTQCPYMSGAKVAGCACRECDHVVKRDFNKKHVLCSYKRDNPECEHEWFDSTASNDNHRMYKCVNCGCTREGISLVAPKNPDVKLKVGAWYRRRDGDVVGPVENLSCAPGYVYAFTASGYDYSIGGQWDTSVTEHALDLVEEVKKPEPEQAYTVTTNSNTVDIYLPANYIKCRVHASCSVDIILLPGDADDGSK